MQAQLPYYFSAPLEQSNLCPLCKAAADGVSHVLSGLYLAGHKACQITWAQRCWAPIPESARAGLGVADGIVFESQTAGLITHASSVPGNPTPSLAAARRGAAEAPG